ncbi:MAG TPA: PKD domain-containing protein [Streptosporangiaceae bacterium]
MVSNRVLRLGLRALAGLTIIAPFVAVPAVSASAATSPAASQAAALTRAFEAARHLPAAEVGGIRAGTLHVGSADGHQWAIATFTPARSAEQKAAAAFQDGAATGVFTETDGTWQLVQTGLYGCGNGLPAALKAAWNLTGGTACSSSVPAQRAAAQHALAALPATARSAAKTAAAAAVRPAATAAAAPATSPAELPQTIAAIALSQVGVSDTPAVTNFNGVDCDPFSTMVAGFSASSDGCGYDSTFKVENENETWCSDFNKWVWEQAGVTADMNTLNAGAVSFYDWAADQGQTPKVDTGTPQVGDSILFYTPRDFPGFADHVGIVTSVNSDGSIDMVNGDFAATPDVHAEYDTDITSLSAFAASVEGPGEEWAIVTPPTTAQQPTPTGSLSGPATAVAGSTGLFHASGSVAGGSVTGYYWTFGDGRTTNSTGPDVTHAFSEAGLYTVSVTITSSYGTIVTLERNVEVLAASSAVASAPYDGIYYDPLPILQYTFARSGGGLAVDSFDGGSWLQVAVPGDPAAAGNITALSYPDADNADAMTPHGYYRAASGTLAETYQTTSGWVTQDLAGRPAAGSQIVATTTADGSPAVFFVDTAGKVAESVPGSAGWTSREVASDTPPLEPASLALADTSQGTEIFAVGPAGTIKVVSSDGGSWASLGIPAKTTPGGSLAALTTPAGKAAVVYVNSHGGLAEAAEAGATSGGNWDVTDLPGTPAAGTSVAATTYLLPSALPATPGDFPGPPGSTTDSNAAAPLGTEAFYLTASGAPAVTYNNGTGWQTGALPGTATSIVAATAYQVQEEPSNLFLSTASGLTEETTGARSGDPSGSWTSVTLPDTPATWADRIVLYAATSGDATAARAGAAAAGLPASQVTTSFAAAWADTLSGEYLVIAVGTAANSALYYNVCGWANPSALPAGSTPFSLNNVDLPTFPPATTPLANVFEYANGPTAAATQAWATDLAYYALNGTMPAGVTALPPGNGLPYECLGSPS